VSSLKTSDIGVAIADALEQFGGIDVLDWDSEDPATTPIGRVAVAGVDASDPHNPVLHTADGVYRVSVVKIG